MMTVRLNIADAFYRGNYRDILAATVDSGQGGIARGKAHFVIAALAFVGRIDEALIHFDALRARMTDTAVVASRFFLGVGFARLSHYETARRYFTENLLLVRRGDLAASSLFYVYQGIGFYRFLGSRFPQALLNAQKAFKFAILANYSYGRVLAADLKGHTLVKSGDIAAGIQSLEEALHISEMLGNGGIKNAVIISLANYRAQFGLSQGDAVQAIQDLIREIPPEDCYSHASLHLELSRQLSLRGEWLEAQATLARAAHQVYATGHRRFSVLLNLRYAYNSHLNGANTEALNLLRHARLDLNPFTDLALETELIGLELRVLAELDPLGSYDDLQRRLTLLTHRTGAQTAHNILARSAGQLSPRRHGLDPIADLCDLTLEKSAGNLQVLMQIIESGYLRFLPQCLGVAVGEQVLVFDLVPSSLLIINGGGIRWVKGGVSPTLKHFVLELSRGRKTKSELVQTIWGYSYHALRHDPLVYALVNRLRRILADAAHWIQATGDGSYYLLPMLRIQCHEHDYDAFLLPQDPVDSATAHLNHRQLAALGHLSSRDSLDVKSYQQLFNVSRITATRDLTGLFLRQLVRRVGKGRATVYQR